VKEKLTRGLKTAVIVK